VLLLKNHMQVGADLMEQLWVFQLFRGFGEVLHLPVEPSLQEIDLFALYILPQHIDQLQSLALLPSLARIRKRSALGYKITVRKGDCFSKRVNDFLTPGWLLVIFFTKNRSNFFFYFQL
jgi:hypothetical protein